MNMKKISALLAVLCLIFTLVPVSVFAAGSETAVTIQGKGTAALTDIMGKTSFADVISFSLYNEAGEKITYNGVLDMDRNSETYLTQLTTPEAKAKIAEQGWSKASTAGSGAVKIVEKPADSDLTENDVVLAWVGTVLTIKSAKEITAEGKYTFEVVLDNGASATASCDAKGFTTPVQLRITGTTCVELGAPAYLKATWYDESGVPKNATNGENVKWTVTGAAGYHYLKAASRYAIFADTADSSAGSTIEVSAVDEATGLEAKHTVKIAAAGEKTLVWDKTDAVTGEENAYTVAVHDANGDAVKLCCCSATVEYTVIDKPVGADVTVAGSWKNGTQGLSGAMTLVSNKPGQVTVQATVSFTMASFEEGEDGKMVEKEAGIRTYTGTQTFTVTGEEVVSYAAEEPAAAPQTFDVSVIMLAAAAVSGLAGIKVLGKKRS